MPKISVPINLEDIMLAGIVHDHSYSDPSKHQLDTKELAEICALDHSYAKPADSPQIVVLRPRFVSFIIIFNDRKYEFKVKFHGECI